MAQEALVVTDAQALNGSFLQEIVSEYRLSLANVTLISQAAILPSKRLPGQSSSVDMVISVAESPGYHTSGVIGELARVLRPGGTLVLQEPIAKRSAVPEEAAKLGASAAAKLQSQPALERALLLAGFTGAAHVSPFSSAGLAPLFAGLTPASVGSTQGPLLQPFAVRVQKPSWATGSSFKLKRSKVNPGEAKVNGAAVRLSLDEMDEVTRVPSAAAAAMAAAAPPAAAAMPAVSQSAASWTLVNGDLEEDEDLVDEEALLTAEDLAPPLAVPAEDCGAGAAKKACKNCTCGRAEMEVATESEKLTIDQLSNPQSACGSCGLGDAFRCAGCPYRGLPAFKLGEKIALPNSMLTADV